MTIVADYAGFVPDLESRGYGGLVGATGYYHGQERPTGEGHAVRFLNYGCESEHLGVHFQGGDSARSDDNGTETLKDRFNSDGGIETGEMKNGIWDGCGIRFIGFKNKNEAFVVCSSEGGERGHFLKGLVVFDICKFKCPDEGCETLSAKTTPLLAVASC